MDGSVMQLFYDLAEDQPTSIAATNLLIEKLQTTDKDSITYTWQRLVKGAPSNRKNARNGFAVALTELLLQFPDIRANEVYEFCKKTNLPSGHVSQKEVRDLYAGFVFCVSALHRSGRLKQIDLCLSILNELFQIIQKRKLTIRDMVFKVFIDILDSVKCDDLVKVMELIGDELKKGWVQCTTERLALMSYIEKRDASLVSKILKKHWNYSHLHHPHNYDKISVVLKGLLCEDKLRPQLSLILDGCTSSPHLKVKKASNLFFSVTDSGENKNTVIFMMVHFLNSLPDDKVEAFVCKHMSEYLKKTFASSPDSVQYMTSSVCKRIAELQSSEIKLSIAKTVLSIAPCRASCFHNILDVLFDSCPIEMADECVAVLESFFIEPKGEETARIISEFRNDCLSWAVQIIRLSNTKTVYEFTKFLFIYSYFEVKGECKEFQRVKIPQPKFSPATVEFCKTKFNSSLKLLTTNSSNKDSKRKGVAEDGRYWVYHLMSSSLSLVTNEKFPMITDITNFDEWTTLWSVIDEIESKNLDTRLPEDWAFELLFLHAGILFFDEQEHAKVVLNDVYQCYEKHKSDSTDNWKSILVDLLISILSYESLMLRNMACECFRIVCNNLDSESIQLIMTALESNDKDDDEEIADEVESDESEEDDDKEDSDEEDDEEEDEGAENDSDIDGEEDEEAEESMVSNDDERDVGDAEEQDINLSDADEEELKNEDKVFGAAIKGLLDMKKEKQKEKKEKALKKVKIVHFKIKILDFIEIIVKDVGFSSATMNILPRLLKLVASPAVTSGPVYNKVLGIFKNMFSMKSDKLNVNFEESFKSDVPVIQEFIIKMSNKKARQMAIQSLFVLCKVHLNNLEPKKKKRRLSKKVSSPADQVYSVFSPILKDFLTNKNTKLDKTLLFQVIERFPTIRPYFVEDVVVFICQDITVYAKMQAIALFQRVLSFADQSTHGHQDQILGAMTNILTKSLDNESPSPHHIRECLKLCLKLHSVATKLKLGVNPLDSDVRSVIENVGVSEIAVKFPDLANLSKKVLSTYS